MTGLHRSDRPTSGLARSPSPECKQSGASTSSYHDSVRSPAGKPDVPPPPPAGQQQQHQTLTLDAASVRALANQLWGFIKPIMEQELKPIAEMADRALVTAKAAESPAEQRQQQVRGDNYSADNMLSRKKGIAMSSLRLDLGQDHSHKAAESLAEQLQHQVRSDKYSTGNMLSRKKRMVMSPLRLDFGQDNSPKARRAAGRSAVESVLSACIKDVVWDVFDVEAYPCKSHKHRGLYLVVFSVQRSEESQLICKHRSALQQQQREGPPVRVSLWVELTPHEKANKARVMAHPAFKAAAAKVLEKPKHTPGYTIGWDLDRGFTVVNGVRTNWHADALPPVGDQQGGYAMEAEGAWGAEGQ